MIDSGVFPIISLASKPIARILLSCSETATTEGSFRIIPFPGKKTKVLAVPKSMLSYVIKFFIFYKHDSYIKLRPWLLTGPMSLCYHIYVKIKEWMTKKKMI